MKVHMITVFMALPLFIAAQTRRLEDILDQKIEKVPIYENADIYLDKVLINMNFDGFGIKNPKVLKLLKGVAIRQIDLVYTDVPKGYDHFYLNKARLMELRKYLPSAFRDDHIRFRLVSQTGEGYVIEPENLFHGFVIMFEPAYSEAGITSYYKNLDDYAGVEDGKKPGFAIDSTVIKVLSRNKWQEMSIVSDFTGSMMPYIGSLLIWYKLHNKDNRVNHYLFFNDGDTLPDNKKKTGATGGLYSGKTHHFDTLLNIAKITISNGFGGDAQENDVEALLKAQEECPDCENLVLIADNMAPMRDLALAGKIKKPVKVILCGTQYGINLAFLQLAYITKGSVHTIEQDITRLVNMREGDEIMIGNEIFRIRDGQFQRINKI